MAKANTINEINIDSASPEKAGVGGSILSLAITSPFLAQHKLWERPGAAFPERMHRNLCDGWGFRAFGYRGASSSNLTGMIQITFWLGLTAYPIHNNPDVDVQFRSRIEGRWFELKLFISSG